MDRFFTIEWTRGESKGSVDEIPTQWFATECNRGEVTHGVRAPRNWRRPAKCSLSVSRLAATLNYVAFEKVNARNGLVIGLLKIGFTSARRDTICSIHWKCKGKGKKFVDWTDGTRWNRIDVKTAEEFDKSVRSAMKLSEAQLLARIANAPRRPQKAEVARNEFARNTDVAALARLRAKGKCLDCGKRAPFLTVAGVPFLEVHHVTRLTDGGEDTIENTIALCPNCHRERHFGVA